ncbi:hypothetical protein [Deinococcus peraridilitoris]|uniref:Lipocalin-like domain-containing protein n=1 Tax=Deinococcus peraridilitoris (strain DSM 19664 / LMG 22246 / CIP 109416 / KR-200) TaxID=937777 RepID=L0A9B8_DEIPD|nr:hypothetical protein [Deinococcus peraridilitoris]AFZ69630.1 hypothetical protein Deipe_4287 [Deinococcus peraridilitoris DSM 19664]
MKNIMYLTALTVTLAACGNQASPTNPPAASPPAVTNVAGTWEGTLTNDASTTFNAKLRVMFTQNQNTLSGELQGYDEKTKQYNRVGPITGTINGNTAQWTLTTPDGSGKMDINGTFNGNTFNGRHTTAISGSGSAKGNVTLTKMTASSHHSTITTQSFTDSFTSLFK